MGLMDILNGMQNGPGGQRQPAPPGQSGGMSPILLALLGLLAYKGMQGGGLGNVLGGNRAPQQPVPGGGGMGGGLGGILGGLFGGNAGGMPRGSGGGLGDILGGMLGGAGGTGTGAVLNGGLGQVINDMQRSGHGRAAQSWVDHGENEPVAPDDLGRALGADTIDQLSQQTGMPREELLQGLSQNLPELVDQLTPEGRLPTNEEASRW